jgi:hypothetical protein
MRPRHRIASNELGIQQIESGVDWITHIGESRKDIELMESLAVDIMREDTDNGSKARPFTFMGYRGWRTARTALGWHSGKALMQGTGNSAGTIATRLRASGGRTTRLDVQATVTLSQSRADFVTSSLKLRRDIPPSLRRSPPRRGQSSDSSGLRIGTVGPRTAPRYLRVYDKGVEKGDAPPGIKWRLELEAKQSLGEMLWRDFQTTEDVPGWCYASLEAQWRLSGCSWLLPRCSHQHCPPRAVREGPSDAVRIAAWLRTTVAPTIPRYLTVYSPAELVEVLGLTSLLSPIPSNHD